MIRRPPVRTASLVALGIVPLVVLASPALAEDEIVVSPESYLSGEPGSVHHVASQAVPEELVGKVCDVRVIASNNGSIHPGNVLVVSTGGSSAEIAGVEDTADGQVIDRERVTLGETFELDLRLGDEGLSSMGFTVGFDCTPGDLVPQVPVTTEPPTTEPPTTEPPVTVSPPTSAAQVPGTTTSTTAPQVAVPVAPPARATTATPTYTG
ncbi:MAG: hypothetical protein ACK5RL_08810 [Acidimicrobiales bacterium]